MQNCQTQTTFSTQQQTRLPDWPQTPMSTFDHHVAIQI